MTRIEQVSDTSVGRETETLSVRPVVLPAPERGEDLRLRVSAPRTGGGLPVVVFSHGYGSSMDAYGPLVDFWAGHGFVVVQPTHLDSATLGLAPDDPRTPLIWRHRIADMVRVLDGIGAIESTTPELKGRVDHGRLAVAGHSWGATTASALLGARVVGSDGQVGNSQADERVTAGVLLALAGTGEELTPFAASAFPFMRASFGAMSTPALLTMGDQDQSQLTTRGPDWWSDGYTQSPSPKSLLTLHDADHYQGGVHAYGGVPRTAAEDPALLALVRVMTTAFLRTALDVDATSWPTAKEALACAVDPAGRIDSL